MQKQRVTVEEYQQLKHRLFVLRRQHARLLHRLPSGMPSNQQAARLRKLERRINKAELELAHTELELSEEKPVTPLDFLYEIGFYLHRIWTAIRRTEPADSKV